jgi:HK97 family phage prohead protease
MAVNDRRRRELVDVRECRATARFEIREAASDEKTITLTGYASTFEPYELLGGPAAGGWIEQIDPGAFTKTLKEKPDLHLLINHEGMPLARTKSGTLDLSVDSHGLKVVARMDRSDPDVQRLETKMRRGDMDEMSFAFRVKDQEWLPAPGFEDDPVSLRLIKEVTLHKGDVSIVNWGANPTTSAELLGSRKKGKNGMRRTLSLAQALSIQAVGATDKAPASVPQLRATRPSGARRLTLAEAMAQIRRDEAAAAMEDRLVERASEILDSAREAAVYDPEPPVFLAQRGAFGTMLPAPCVALAAQADYNKRRRQADALAEVERQRQSLLKPPIGWRQFDNGSYRER